MTVRVINRDRRDTLGEGPLWSPGENALYWVDILDRRLNRLSLADGAIAEWAMPETIGWVIERQAHPGFIAGLGGRIVELCLDPVRIAPIADPEPELAGNRMNDAKADRWGRIWAGTMPIGCDRPSGSLYRLDVDRKLSRIDRGYTVANGPAIGADWLYHTDSGLGIVYRFPLSPDGEIGARETFIRFEKGWGSPDGMTLDSDGGLWIAHWGGSRVSRFDADGSLDTSIALPASQITSCTFAGEGLDRMFVTSAADGVDEPLGGALFEVTTGRRGLTPYKYGG